MHFNPCPVVILRRLKFFVYGGFQASANAFSVINGLFAALDETRLILEIKRTSSAPTPF